MLKEQRDTFYEMKKKDVELAKSNVIDVKALITNLQTAIDELEFDPSKKSDLISIQSTLIEKVGELEKKIKEKESSRDILLKNVRDETSIELERELEIEEKEIRGDADKEDVKLESEIRDIMSQMQVANSDSDRIVSTITLDKDQATSKIEKESNDLSNKLRLLQSKSGVDTLEAEMNKVISDLTHEVTTLKAEALSIKQRAETINESMKGEKQELEGLEETLLLDVIVCPTCKQDVVDADKKQHITNKASELQVSVSEKNSEVRRLTSEFSKVKTNFQSKKTELAEATVRYQKQLDKLKSEVSKKESVLLEQIDKTRNDYRETGSQFDAKIVFAKKRAIETLGNLRQKHAKLVGVRNAKKSEIDGLVEAARTKLDEKYQKLWEDRGSKVCETVSKDIETLRKEEDTYKNKLRLIELDVVKISELEAKHKEFNHDLWVKNTQLEINEKSLIDNQAKEFDMIAINNSNKSMSNSKDRYLDEDMKLREKRELLMMVEFWVDMFSDRGIPSMLIDDSIPTLNKIMKEELEKIAPGKYLFHFDTLSTMKSGDVRDKISVNVLNLENGADKYCMLSGGEKRQIDVCCMRALRMLTEDLYQKSINITLLDEILDSLDEDNASMFCQNLKILSKGQNITLITHSLANSSECDRVRKL